MSWKPDQLWIGVFLIVTMVIFVLYESQLHPISLLSNSITKGNCVISMLESDDFICESDALWNERKILYRIQDELNMKKPMGKPYFLQNWEPNFHCCHARRIGVMGDGGKWVCDLFRLQNHPICLIYSAGSNGDFSFEIDAKKYLPNCEIHTFDFTLYHCPQNVCIFHQVLLGDGKSSNNSKNWQTIIKELGHEDRSIDVFKIDVEGGEFQFFPSIFQTSDRSHPRQILVEVHPLGDTETHRFFELLRENNYVIFNKEPNILMKAELFEYAFLKLNSRFFQ